MMQKGLQFNCQLCYDIGVSESTLSRWRSGRPFSLEHAVELSARLDTSLDHLLTGQSPSAEQSSFSSQLRQLLDFYQLLTKGNEQLLLSLMRSLACRPLPKQSGLGSRVWGAEAVPTPAAPAAPSAVLVGSQCASMGGSPHGLVEFPDTAGLRPST